MNWNYRIRLSGSAERFVLRFCDRMPDVVRQGSAHPGSVVRDDVPCAAGPASPNSPPLGGSGGFPPFCVLEFIDGISLRELRRRGEAAGVAEASYDAGRLLPRLMRHTRFPRTGVLSPELAVEDGPIRGRFAPRASSSTSPPSPLFAARGRRPRSARACEIVRPRARRVERVALPPTRERAEQRWPTATSTRRTSWCRQEGGPGASPRSSTGSSLRRLDPLSTSATCCATSARASHATSRTSLAGLGGERGAIDLLDESVASAPGSPISRRSCKNCSRAEDDSPGQRLSGERLPRTCCTRGLCRSFWLGARRHLNCA